MSAKKFTINPAGFTSGISRQFQSFKNGIPIHTTSSCFSQLFRLPPKDYFSGETELLVGRPEELISNGARHTRNTSQREVWGYQDLVSCLTRNKYRGLTPAMVLSIIKQHANFLAGQKILFILPKPIQIFRGKISTECVLVWDGTRENNERVIACPLDTEYDLNDGRGFAPVAQFSAYDVSELNGYQSRAGNDPLISNLSFQPVEYFVLNGAQVAVARN